MITNCNVVDKRGQKESEWPAGGSKKDNVSESAAANRELERSGNK